MNRQLLKILARTKILLAEKITPRWIIFLSDILIVALSVYLAFLFRFNFNLPKETYSLLLFSEIIIINVRIAFFLIYKLNSHLLRYTSFNDIKRIFLAIIAGSFVLLVLSIVARTSHAFPCIPYSVIAIEFFVSLYFISNLRIIAKSIYMVLFNYELKNKKTLIFGTRDLAVLAKEALELNPTNKYKVIAFLDSHRLLKMKKLMGLSIYGLSDAERLIEKYTVSHIVLAKKDISVKEKDDIARICLDHGIKMLTIPDSWLAGDMNNKEIKELQIEDLLNRKPIQLNKDHIEKALEGKTILFTGAAGSIGSEMVKQVIQYNPMRIILIDQAETPLYDLELEIKEGFGFVNYETILADITNLERMEKIFELFQPDVVYHAAAYKHVPMMENHPTEAVKNNVLGTQILADLAHKHKVKKFIMVSTDKAVNPTGIMGATKRMAEIYIQSLNNLSTTNFITTRFGNVLNSNGSVIPRFLKQIKEGGPVTVTHPDITRFFMTIPEACQLVLEASVMGNGGEIYLFDMGKAVKILDLAKNLIKYSGHILDKDIKIRFTGLRPGEKLYEELLLESENSKPTHHPKIRIAEVHPYDFCDISNKITALHAPLKQQNVLKLVRLMKEIVPTYKSQNSVYEKLDKAI